MMASLSEPGPLSFVFVTVISVAAAVTANKKIKLMSRVTRVGAFIYFLSRLKQNTS